MKKYIKDCSRMMSDDDIEIWKKGEKYLLDTYGISIHSKFERNGGWVDIYYEEEEGREGYKKICEFLKKDENFDKLCDDFVELIIQKQELQAKMMSALIIFDEIDNYPEIASDYIKRRLIRIRTSTHEESYK